MLKNHFFIDNKFFNENIDDVTRFCQISWLSETMYLEVLYLFIKHCVNPTDLNCTP